MMKKSKIKGCPHELGGVISAMIPGAAMDKKGHISVNVDISKDTLIFNIGGVIFETYRSTLHRMQNSPLANERLLNKHYRAEKKDYFFDRDPDIFRATLNYLRTGELHIPSNMCGSAVKKELEYWGISPNRLEKCCWTNFNDWNSTLEALNKLEKHRTCSLTMIDINTKIENSFWRNLQLKISNVLQNPMSCFDSKLYGIVSLLFILMSISTFVVETTTLFDVPHSATGNTSITDENNISQKFLPKSVLFNSPEFNHKVLNIIEYTCLAFFTVQYIVQFVFAPVKLRFITSTMGIIDFFAMMPDYIEIIVHVTLNDSREIYVIEVCRIFRMFRIFRLIKHVPGLWILVYTLKASFGDLMLLMCFMCVGILVFASFIYFVEDREDFPSIPHGFWWAVITMATVGYGDMCPKTALGKVIGSMCAISGLLMVGFTVPTLANNFSLYQKYIQFSMHDSSEETTDCKISSTVYSSQKDTEKDTCKGNDIKTDSNGNEELDIPLKEV